MEKHLEDALENKSCEKFDLKKYPNKTKHAHNHNFKNKTKRTRRVWVEKGTSHFMNTYACTATCFYCIKRVILQTNAILNILVFLMGSIIRCLFISRYFYSNPKDPNKLLGT